MSEDPSANCRGNIFDLADTDEAIGLRQDVQASPMSALDKSEVAEIDPTLCDVFPGNGRADTLFCPKRNAGLVEDIRANGQQTPVFVRVIGERFEVIAGTRRLGAVLALRENRPSIRLRAIIVQASTEQAWMLAEKENADRRNLTPIQRARSWRYAINRFHQGRQDLFAAAAGEHPTTVCRTLALLEIPQDVLSAMRDPENVSVHFAAQLQPVLKDAERRANIIATAQNIAAQTTLPGPALLERLLSTPQEIAARAPVSFALGDNERHAVLKRKPDGSALLSIRYVTAKLADERARRAFLRSIEGELKKLLQL